MSQCGSAVETGVCRSERRFRSERKLLPKHLPKRFSPGLTRVRSEVRNHAEFQRTEIPIRTEPESLPFGFSSTLTPARTEERNQPQAAVRSAIAVASRFGNCQVLTATGTFSHLDLKGSQKPALCLGLGEYANERALRPLRTARHACGSRVLGLFYSEPTAYAGGLSNPAPLGLLPSYSSASLVVKWVCFAVAFGSAVACGLLPVTSFSPVFMLVVTL